MGLVTGPHPHIPRTNSQWVAGPGCTPQGRAVGPGRTSNPGRPTRRQGAPAPGALLPPPQCAKPAHKSTRCGVGDGSPRQHIPHPQPVGSGPRPHAPRTGGRARGSARPRTPYTQARDAPPPRARSCCPRSGQCQLARARPVGLVTGPHAHTPGTHSQWVAGPGRTLQGRAVGRGRAPNPGHPKPRREAPPPRCPRAAPTARKATSQKQACPQGGERPLARQRDEVTGLPPRRAKKAEHGTGA